MSSDVLPARTPAASARTTQARAPERPPRARAALAVILAAQLMLIVDATVMNVALPQIQADLGFSAAGLSWVMTGYAVTFGGLLLLGGRAGDAFGRRKLFLGGLTLFTLASLAGGFATSAGLLIAARLLQGIGAAAAGPNVLALITSTFAEPRARLRALALFSGISSAGFAVGLTLGGLLTEVASWRWVLFINVPIGLAVVPLAARLVREPARHAARLDIPGAILATTGVASLVAALTRVAEASWSDRLGLTLLVVGVALLAVFVVVESRTRSALLPLRLLADRNRAAGYLMFILGPAAMMSMLFFLTQYLQELSGFSAFTTGLAFLPMAAVIFALTRVVPALLTRFGPRPLVVSGLISMALGLLWLTALTPDSSYVTDLLGPIVLMGIGIGAGFTPLTPVIMTGVAPEDTGAAGGAMQTSQQMGASLGLAVLVSVFGTAVAHAGGTPAEATVYGMTRVFLGGLGFVAAALVIAVAVIRPRR